ncbi:MAG TPA: cell division protein SepF [Tissierellaceae bacterium]|nr:cell division protein SepF [Tissierellaceae bacterium]
MSSFMDKFKYFIGIEDYDDEDEVLEEEVLDAPVTTQTKRINNKVLNIHTSNSMKIVVREPLTYEEAPEIVEELKSRKVVVINFEQLDINLKRQIFDFINGALYAIEGKIQKVTKDIFILAPSNVEIDGLKDELKSRGVFPW